MTNEFYWNKAITISKTAIEAKSLVPLKTNIENLITSPDYLFELKSLITNFVDKDNNFGPAQNPFSPWDPNLEIANISNNHILILNKFPVQKGHMLLITNKWAPQNGWLTLEDFNALELVNNDTTGLWFFNSSPLAGASQPHRHLQLLRREQGSASCPREKWFKDLLYSNSSSSSLLTRSCKIRSNLSTKGFKDILYQNYLELAFSLNLGSPNSNKKPSYPYNLLITSEWIALIRRSRECIHGFSLNALGFAGYLLSKPGSDTKWLSKNGPIKLLEGVVDPL